MPPVGSQLPRPRARRDDDREAAVDVADDFLRW